MYSKTRIFRIYAQSPDAILHLICRLAHQRADMAAQLNRFPQPLIASLSKELAKAMGTL